MERLDDAKIDQRLAQLDGWERDGDTIRKTYHLDSFGEAIGFVHDVAELAEQVDHHPNIDIRYDKVTLSLSTHSVGGLTTRDFDLAQHIDDR